VICLFPFIRRTIKKNFPKYFPQSHKPTYYYRGLVVLWFCGVSLWDFDQKPQKIGFATFFVGFYHKRVGV